MTQCFRDVARLFPNRFVSVARFPALGSDDLELLGQSAQKIRCECSLRIYNQMQSERLTAKASAKRGGTRLLPTEDAPRKLGLLKGGRMAKCKDLRRRDTALSA
jgi:hypothetical protein